MNKWSHSITKIGVKKINVAVAACDLQWSWWESQHYIITRTSWNDSWQPWCVGQS